MTTDDDAIPPAMGTLLELFTTELADVRFGEIDRPALEKAATAVRAAARELAEVESLAETARASLDAARDALLQKGQRALAYARIYAEGSPALDERLQAINLGRALRRPEPIVAETAPRPRGRPPKQPKLEGATLPLTGTAPRRQSPPEVTEETPATV
jgi:hypothetical protein